jgi:hypothetical protein
MRIRTLERKSKSKLARMHELCFNYLQGERLNGLNLPEGIGQGRVRFFNKARKLVCFSAKCRQASRLKDSSYKR